MKRLSYLLALDGSLESKSAANLAWTLAQRTGARVVAQHVINVRDTWRFLRPKSAGFIGSGPYMDAFNRVTSGLRSIAEALMLSYTSQVTGQNIEFETYIDEGDPAAEICKRAVEHDLVIIGHTNISRENTTKQDRSRLCAELAELCPHPLLIVYRNNIDSWTKMKINIIDTSVDPRFINALGDFGQRLGLAMDLYFNPSIKNDEFNQWTTALASYAHGKSWGIHHEKNGHMKGSPENELTVLVPSIKDKTGINQNLGQIIEDFNGSTLLIWRQENKTEQYERAVSTERS